MNSSEEYYKKKYLKYKNKYLEFKKITQIGGMINPNVNPNVNPNAAAIAAVRANPAHQLNNIIDENNPTINQEHNLEQGEEPFNGTYTPGFYGRIGNYNGTVYTRVRDLNNNTTCEYTADHVRLYYDQQVINVTAANVNFGYDSDMQNLVLNNNNRLRRPLEIAIETRNRPLIERLLQIGADKNIIRRDENNHIVFFPLHRAVALNDNPTVRILLNGGGAIHNPAQRVRRMLGELVTEVNALNQACRHLRSQIVFDILSNANTAQMFQFFVNQFVHYNHGDDLDTLAYFLRTGVNQVNLNNAINILRSLMNIISPARIQHLIQNRNNYLQLTQNAGLSAELEWWIDSFAAANPSVN